MNILAIDASTRSSGWAYFQENDLIDYGCLKASSTDMINRIEKIINELNSVLQQHPVDKIVLEEVRPEEKNSQGFSNIKTYKALMYLQAAINFLIHHKYNSIEIIYKYPSEWRKECGIHTGRGIKREILKQESIDFAKSNYSLQENINDDIADAIGLGHSEVKSNFIKNELNWE